MAPIAAADESAFLDPPYPGASLRGVWDDAAWGSRGLLDSLRLDAVLPTRSDFAAALGRQSPVKSQGQRGTCSIFASTALMESFVIAAESGGPVPDLSEEWLEYAVTRKQGRDGSSWGEDFAAISAYGLPPESDMPYLGEIWLDDFQGLRKQRCGSIQSSKDRSACLIGHRDPRLMDLSSTELGQIGSPFYDPDFEHAREDAKAFRERYLGGLKWSRVSKVSEIKKLLAQGIPLVVDMDFFFGAWNHRKGLDFGIPVDPEAWSAGVVGYPEPGSLDAERSKKGSSGHSVVVVGYDDSVVVTTQSTMKDGSAKEFTYSGVYYFKNSWGTTGFGAAFNAEGVSAPGYGMITQKYLNQYGDFFRLSN